MGDALARKLVPLNGITRTSSSRHVRNRAENLNIPTISI